MDLRNGFDIRRYIRTIPDYPKPGILFRDITTLLANLHGFRAAVDELAWPFLRGDSTMWRASRRAASSSAARWRMSSAAASCRCARRASCRPG
jgi:hypothetical protein